MERAPEQNSPGKKLVDLQLVMSLFNPIISVHMENWRQEVLHLGTKSLVTKLRKRPPDLGLPKYPVLL